MGSCHFIHASSPPSSHARRLGEAHKALAPKGGAHGMQSEQASDASTALATASYQQLLDEVGAFIYTADLQGSYTYANRLVLEMLGRSLQDVIGRTFAELVGAARLDDALDETDRQVMQEGETIAREEAHLIPGSEQPRVFWSVKKPLRDSEGRIIGLLGISYDITEKVRLEARLREQKTLLDAVLDHVDALVYMKDANRRFQYANQRVAQMFGTPVEQIIGKLDSELMPREVADRFWAIDQDVIHSQQPYATEVSLTDARGDLRHYWSVIVPWANAEGTQAVVGMSTDITTLHELKEELQRQARTDSLTGCANRRYFFELAESEYARCRRHGSPLSMIAIDLDHFKQINDRYGHPVGDLVLQDFVGCCRGLLREIDIFARTGGEEFCILLPETPLDAAREIAERIRTMTMACQPVDAHPALQISASFGASSLGTADADFHALFARADRALYAAKAQGRNRTVMLPPS